MKGKSADIRLTTACTHLLRMCIVLILCAFNGAICMGQRTVTPVESDDNKPQQPVLHYYDKHGKPLDEPVLFLASLDTVAKVKAGPVYPLITDLSMGVNIWDLAMKMTGQAYTGVDVWAELPLWNWLAPTAEFGVGWADKCPKDGNYHYKGKPSIYAKVGANYNFLYKSNPDYQLYAGFRIGFSHFKYDIRDISISSPYWAEHNLFEITDQTSTAVYTDFLAGIKVKIWKHFSMGWSFRYHLMMHCPDASMSVPAYIPGYGSRTSNITATFSLIYTIPLKSYTIYAPPSKH